MPMKAKFRANIRAIRRAQLFFLLLLIVVGIGGLHPVLQTVSAISLIVFLSCALRRSERHLFRSPPVSSVGYVLLLQGLLWLTALACGLLLMSGVISWLGEWRSTAFLEKTLRDARTESFSFLTIVNMVILAPLYEELFFRGCLLGAYRAVGDRFAILLSALLFAAAHEIFFNSLYTFLMGFLLAVLTIRYNSILPSFLFHMLNNLAAIFFRATNAAGPETTAEAFSDFVRAILDAKFGLLSCSALVVAGGLSALFRLARRLRRQSGAEAPLLMTIYEAGQILFHWPIVLMEAGFVVFFFKWAENWVMFFSRFPR
jgi:membrane protease YdiL (CAAX protease family)